MTGVEELAEEVRNRQCWMVAIAGIPGAGKSTLAAELSRRIPGSIVLPMDGYHRPRSALTPDQMARRGAPDTFDAESLRRDLAGLRERREGVFPAFDHAVKDPQPGAIVVPRNASMVIVEGLYLLLREWQLEELFDVRIFLDCDIDLAMERVARRNFAAGISPTLEASRARAQASDRRNAERILADGGRERADIVFAKTD